MEIDIIAHRADTHENLIGGRGQCHTCHGPDSFSVFNKNAIDTGGILASNTVQTPALGFFDNNSFFQCCNDIVKIILAWSDIKIGGIDFRSRTVILSVGRTCL